jgi:arylsulfatase A-like enzyme
MNKVARVRGAFALGVLLAGTAVAAERPNVLLILLDDLGYSDLGCYGGEIPTPNIDRLADGGVRMTQLYNSARCCPSRASLVTGLHPHQTGIGSFAHRKPVTNRGPAYIGNLNNKCVTMAEVLDAAGYQTYMVGKWHMSEPGPVERGFDEFYGYVHGYEQDQWEPDRYVRLPRGRKLEISRAKGEFYATDVFTDYAVEFLNQAQRKDDPWFLYLAHSSPHFPVQAPRESVAKFVETYRKGWDVLRAERYSRMKKMGLITPALPFTPRSLVPVEPSEIANGFPGMPNPAWDTLPADRREDLAYRAATFAAMVSHVDTGVGRIVNKLRASGQLENTLILLLSDNGACYEWGPFGFDGPSRKAITKLHKGEELQTMGGPGSYHSYGSAWANLGNTPLRLYKHFTHEGGISSPFIAHWPAGIRASAGFVREPAHLVDVMPTVMAATGAKYPESFNGHSILPVEGENLLPVFAGETLSERGIGFEHQGARGLRRGKWKVVWSKRMPYEIEWELYDMENDRSETKNLADEHPEIVKKLVAEWEQWARRVGAEPFNLPGE